MCKYVGITIGPIYDTMVEASTPAALWFASSLFSDITRRLCAEIKRKEGFQDAVILSPFFSDITINNDGIGKYHDRIIFSTCLYERERLDGIISKVKNETCLQFPKEIMKDRNKSFLHQYLQIHYVVLSKKKVAGTNSILALSPYLDALELMKTFPKDNLDNPIKQLFFGEKDSQNRLLKKSSLFDKVKSEMIQLKKPAGTIWTMEEIASDHGKSKENLKKYKYYAVVQADGDNMGRFLSNLGDGRVTEFSETLLDYAEETAALVGKYGGMTIYAGGDDLLLLAPVENEAGQTVFGLCREVGELFRKQLSRNFSEDAEALPTVSFGISIQYIKYPLYEALETARKLLGMAKSDTNKDKTAIEVRKHSGRSISLILSNSHHREFENFLKLGEDNKNNGETVKSVITTLEKFERLIFVINQQVKNNDVSADAYENIWINFFDNPEQKQAEGYIREVGKTYYEFLLKRRAEIIVPETVFDTTDQETKKDSSLQVLLHLLWLKNFLAERGEEE